MTDEEHKKVFANNLNKYIYLNCKQQKEVAEAIGVNPTTFNMWCKGNAMPNVGKIQKLADYFGVGKSDLIDYRENKNADEEYADIVFRIAKYDERFRKIITEYGKLPVEKENLICDFLKHLFFNGLAGVIPLPYFCCLIFK